MQLFSLDSSHSTSLTQLISHKLISHNSSPSTHLTHHLAQLISHKLNSQHSSHTTTSHHSSHTTHLTKLNSTKSSHTTLTNTTHPTHLTHIIFHPSPYTTDMIQISSFLSSYNPAFLTHIATHVVFSGPLIYSGRRAAVHHFRPSLEMEKQVQPDSRDAFHQGSRAQCWSLPAMP